MKYETKEGKTFFTLEPGTEFRVGSETVTLTEQTVVSVAKDLSFQSVVETIQGSGTINLTANESAFVLEEPKKKGK